MIGLTVAYRASISDTVPSQRDTVNQATRRFAMQTKRFLTVAAVAALISGPALAFGGNAGESYSVSTALEAGAAGSSLTKGGVDGGSYAKGKNGSSAYSFSGNYVTNTGTATVGLGQSMDTRTAYSIGGSKAVTNGAGAVAEAYEERSTFGKSKTSFDLGVAKSHSFSYSWGLGY